MSEGQIPRAFVLGLGNPFMGDDGVGIAALERLRERWILPPSVEAAAGRLRHWGHRLEPATGQTTPPPYPLLRTG